VRSTPATAPRLPPRPGWRTKGISSGCGSHPPSPGEIKVLGLYRADSAAQLAGLLADLPVNDWMQTTVIPLEPHPNDAVPREAACVTATSRP
jgi:muconolactone delta-isomerase